jgi:hypothetical protein
MIHTDAIRCEHCSGLMRRVWRSPADLACDEWVCDDCRELEQMDMMTVSRLIDRYTAAISEHSDLSAVELLKIMHSDLSRVMDIYDRNNHE